MAIAPNLREMKLRMAGAILALALISAGPVAIERFKSAVFTATTPLARNDQLINRLFRPFFSADLAKKNDAATLSSFPVNPKDETFGLYVPRDGPARGYGLLIWVSPLDRAGMPPGWPEVLESRGVIYVTAARSGNETAPIGRRIPLALIAAANVMNRFPVNPDRVWISGFSGGARIAERIALAYPDVFSGAILDGSSDPFGNAEVPLPPRELFERLLDRMAFVISTGQRDRYNNRDAKRFLSSLRQHCLTRVSVEARPRDGHQMMNGSSLGAAIEYLDRPRDPLTPEQRQCREQLYSKIDRELVLAETMALEAPGGARAAIRLIDRRYGHLAAPRSLELRARVGEN